MICPNCGETLPDGSRFCGNCGMNMALRTSEEKTPPLTPSSPDKFSEAEEPEDMIVGVKKRRNVKKTVAICAAVALVVFVAGMFAWRALSAGASVDALISLSNGKYYLIKGQKGKPIEFASLRAVGHGSNDYADLLSFSPDRRYAYYFTRVDDNFTGSLCRVEYKKLKLDSGKNENYTELIASNVSMNSLTFVDSSTFVYKNSDDTLYYFNGREAVQIARNVNRFITEGNAIVYSIGDYEQGYSLYATSVKGSDEKMKLASDIDGLYLFENVNSIVYAKEGDDGSTALYLTGLSKETVKLTSNANIILAYMGLDSLYFTESSPNNAVALYDFISDPDAAADSSLQEPDREAFRIITYNYRLPSLDGLDESAYPELYSSIEVIQNALQRNYGGVADEVWVLLQQFQDRFSGAANADGYVLVTEEVQSLLRNILTESGQDASQWGYLCHVREVSPSSDYDYSAYYEAVENYRAIYSKNELRDTLKDRTNGIALSTLYRVAPNGSVVKILENVVNSSVYGAAFLCMAPPDSGTFSNKLSFSNVFETDMSPYQVQDWIMDEYLNGINPLIQVVPINPDTSVSTPLTLSAKAINWLRDMEDDVFGGSMCISEGLAFIMFDDETLWSAAVSGGTIGEFTQVAEDVFSIRFDDKSLYYRGNQYTNGDGMYGDFYSYKNGERVRIAQDILIASEPLLYADGAATAYTGYRSDRGYELTMFSGKGTKTIIGDDIKSYSRLSKSALLYVSEGDLRLYNGKSRVLIQEDVDQFWTVERMESTLPNGYMSEYEYYNYD